jgi:hypothetical protein
VAHSDGAGGLERNRGDFQLHRDGDYTIVMFSHRYWREEGEFMGHCSIKWAVFMLSLKELDKTAKGKPAPHDVQIDNWN